MTREEAIDTLKKALSYYYDSLRPCPEYEYIGGALHTLKNEIFSTPSLPSNLDEAAKDYSMDMGFGRIGPVQRGFKAGSKWMAEQGVTYEDIITSDKTFPVLQMKDVSEYGLDYGDKVIVQVRKI